MTARGIVLKVGNKKTIAEEAAEAYKDVDTVVGLCDRARVSRMVVRLVPIVVVKG